MNPGAMHTAAIRHGRILDRATTEARIRTDGLSARQVRGASVYDTGEVILGHQGSIGNLAWAQFKTLVAEALDGKLAVRP